MSIVKIVCIGIVGCVCALLIKKFKPEMGIVISIITSCIILSYLFNEFSSIIDVLNDFAVKAGMDKEYYYIVLKIIGISYLCEFGANIAKDSGESGISSKIELGGKVFIVITALPILSKLFELIVNIIN